MGYSNIWINEQELAITYDITSARHAGRKQVSKDSHPLMCCIIWALCQVAKVDIIVFSLTVYW